MKSFHDINKIDAMGQVIKGAKRYVFQQYQYSDKQIINEDFKYFTRQEMSLMAEKIRSDFHVKEVLIRGKF
jgi:hypothetical protein